MTLSEFQTLTQQEIAAIIEARDQIRLENLSLLRVALGEHGQAAIDALSNGADAELRVRMEQMADRILSK